MTKEEFEKEAEKAGNEKIRENNQLARCARKSYKDGFKDGAEYVYNKCNTELTKAKEIIRDLLQVLPKENIEGIYEITEEAEQFLNSEVEK